MSDYRRAFQPGGTFFFTVVSYRRRPFLTEARSRQALRQAFEHTRVRFPFRQEAVVLLPDHLHCLWTLPEGDADFSVRWKVIKFRFDRLYLGSVGSEATVGDSGRRRRERGLWQRRFWEHTVRNAREFEILCNYIHYNPVKHGYATCPHAWPFSTFGKCVAMRRYPADWCCGCDRPVAQNVVPQPESTITGE